MKRGSWLVSFGADEGKNTQSVLSNRNSWRNSYSGRGSGKHTHGCNKTESMADSGSEVRGAETVGEAAEKDSKIDSSRLDSVESNREAIDQHFKSLELQVIAATETELSKAEDERYKMAATINQETERDIRRLYERRDERLRKNHNDIEKRRQMIVEKRFELVQHIQSLGNEVLQSAEKLKKKNRDGVFVKPTSSPKLHRSHAKLTKKLSGGHHKNGGDQKHEKSKPLSCSLEGVAKMVQEIAMGISFMKLDGVKVGRINGAKDRWVLEEKIKVSPTVGVPALKGSINSFEVVIEDIKTSSIYVTNIQDKTTRMVIEEKTPLFNCASHDGSVVVCAGSRNGRVALYDKSWNHLRNLSLPEKFLSGVEAMCVAVDASGKILIAQYGGNSIHVFNPTGSQWLNTIELEEMIPIHGIHALPSGVAVHSAMYGEQVCILDKDGRIKTNVFLEESEEKCMSILCADPVSNALYNLTCGTSSGQCTVEELCDLTSDEVTPEKVIEFAAPRLADGLIAGEGFSILRSHKMVTCDGDQLLVFGKRRGIEHLRQVISDSHSISKHDKDT